VPKPVAVRRPCASCAGLEDQVRELTRELDARRADVRELERARRALREEVAGLRQALMDVRGREL
jgi:chromosome segregation ATPase